MDVRSTIHEETVLKNAAKSGNQANQTAIAKNSHLDMLVVQLLITQQKSGAEQEAASFKQSKKEAA